MRNISVVPNMITAFGLSCGLFIIFKISMTDSLQEEPEVLTMMVWLLLVAGVADLLDGAIARAVKAESEFGSFFDSLSDAITFGVAPSVIILKTLSLAPSHSWTFFVNAAAMVYSICGVLRLGRYCVSDGFGKRKGQLLAESCHKHFTGLPIPAAAGAAVSANLVLASSEFHEWIRISEMTRARLLTLILVFLGYLMVSHIKFPSLKALQIRLPSFPLVFLTVFSAVLVLYGIINCLHLTLVGIFWGYILIALMFSILRLLSGKRSKRFEEYAPDEEEVK